MCEVVIVFIVFILGIRVFSMWYQNRRIDATKYLGLKNQVRSRNLEKENEGKMARSCVPTSHLSVAYNYPKSPRVLQLLHFKKEVKTLDE